MKHETLNDLKTQSVAEAVKHVLQHSNESQYDLVSEGKMKELHALMSKGMKDPKKIAKELGLADTKEVHSAIAQLIKKEFEVMSKLDQDVIDLHTIDKIDDPEQQKYTEAHCSGDGKKRKKEDASNDVSDDGEGLDKVDKKAVKKKFKDRKDKDIDNDGDVDDADEYLHKRRKAISKATSESVSDDEEEAIKANDSELKKTMPKQAKVEDGHEDDQEEGNAFGKAVMAAKKRGDKDFIFAGKKYMIKEKDVVSDEEEAIKANDSELKKTMPKQAKVESFEIQEGKFDKLEKKLGRINPETLGDVMDGKIKLNPAERKEFNEFMKGVRKMFGESIDENRAVVYNPRMIKAFIKQAEKKFPKYKGEIQQAEDDEIVFPNDPKLINFFKGAKEVKFVLKDSFDINENNIRPNLKAIVNIRREMAKLQIKIDYAVFEGDAKAVDKLSDELNKLRKKLVNFYKKESVTYSEKLINKILEKKNLDEAMKFWKVTITKKAGKLFKGQNVVTKARNSAEAIKKGIKQMKGNPALVPGDSVTAELDESANLKEAISPKDFIKGGDKKISTKDIGDVMDRIFLNDRLMKQLEKTGAFKEGKKDKGKKKNPFKKDTIDFHHYELGVDAGQAGF